MGPHHQSPRGTSPEPSGTARQTLDAQPKDSDGQQVLSEYL